MCPLSLELHKAEVTERFSFKPAGRAVNTVMLRLHPGGRPGGPGAPILLSLPIRVVQESRRGKKCPTEAPPSAKSSVRVETQLPSSVGAGSQAPSVEAPQPQESGGEEGKAAGPPLHCCRERLC